MMKMIEREGQIREYEICQMNGNVPLTSEVIFGGFSLSSKPEVLGCSQIVCACKTLI